MLQVTSGVYLTTLVGLCMAYPFAYPSIPAFQQQRQFYFAPLPAASNPTVAQFPFAAPPSSNYVYFAPQAQPQQIQQFQPQRLVSPAPSALRYPAPTTAVAAGNGQYVVVYPGGTVGAVPGGSVVYVGRQGEGESEGEGSGSGWTDFFGNIGEYFSWPFSPSAPAPGTPGIEAPVEGSGSAAAPAPAVPAKPEKVESAENKPEAEKQQDNAIFAAQPQRFVVVGQPQFFGHFAALQKANPVSVPSAANGAISSFLLLRNGINQEIVADDPVVSADGPGSAALAYQRLLVLSKKQQQQQKETAEAVSVTVDAKETQTNSSSESSTPAPSSNEESENVDAENEEGPSIAQAKPQAISLAGPGGVAAAAPVGTALVGPGGMALSAPSATAVAGPTSGAPISIAPANKAAKTYFLAQQNPQYLFQYKP